MAELGRSRVKRGRNSFAQHFLTDHWLPLHSWFGNPSQGVQSCLLSKTSRRLFGFKRRAIRSSNPARICVDSSRLTEEEIPGDTGARRRCASASAKRARRLFRGKWQVLMVATLAHACLPTVGGEAYPGISLSRHRTRLDECAMDISLSQEMRTSLSFACQALSPWLRLMPSAILVSLNGKRHRRFKNRTYQ